MTIRYRHEKLESKQTTKVNVTVFSSQSIWLSDYYDSEVESGLLKHHTICVCVCVLHFRSMHDQKTIKHTFTFIMFHGLEHLSETSFKFQSAMSTHCGTNAKVNKHDWQCLKNGKAQQQQQPQTPLLKLNNSTLFYNFVYAVANRK